MWGGGGGAGVMRGAGNTLLSNSVHCCLSLKKGGKLLQCRVVSHIGTLEQLQVDAALLLQRGTSFI